MSHWIKVIAILLGFFNAPNMAATQNLPVLNMGFSGGGVGSDMLKVIERANLWRKHGVDVRPIYLTSGSLMAQTLSAGDEATRQGAGRRGDKEKHGKYT